jgi:large subunit ribosomal protein L15
MKLNDLMPNEGTTKKRKRVGRGISAGQGKTCGRGTKGQSSRAGWGGKLARQGGNLPFYRKLPFIRGEGFTPINRVRYNEINVSTLAQFPAGSEITPAMLVELNLLSKPARPVAILGMGDLTIALKVHVHRVSKGARAKIEAAGGSVEIIQ